MVDVAEKRGGRGLPVLEFFNGICQTANSDITPEQMTILNRCGVLRVVDDKDRVMVETPFYNIPRLMRQDD